MFYTTISLKQIKTLMQVFNLVNVSHRLELVHSIYTDITER